MTLPKMFKKKRFWLIAGIIVIILVFILAKIFGGGGKIEYTTESVKRGKLMQTVTATGGVESANEIALNFKAGGRITGVSVKEGDVVKSGQELARLDTASAGASLRQYQANLASALANLEKVKAGASFEDITLTEEQLTKSQNDLNNLYLESAGQIDILREKVIDSLNNSVFASQSALNVIYNDLINTETTYNLLVSDSNLQNKVKNDYELTKNNFNNLKTSVTEASANKNDSEKIITVSDKARDFLTTLNDLLNDSYRLADVIIINTTYTTTKKDTVKSDISTQQAANNTTLTSVQTAKANLINSSNSYTSQIQAASNSLAISQAQLNLKKAGPRNFDINSAQAAVAQAHAQLDKLGADLQDYYIRAPIDGKITKVNYEIGETPSTDAVIAMLGNERYEIKADIPESDITKIKVGDKTIIELDAFGSDHPFKGTITFIDPAQTIIKDVIYYKITVSFDEDSWNDQIKPGMTANITVSSNEKNDVLYIPQRAVKIKETTLGEVPVKYVEILVNGAPQEKIVTVGLRGDNGLVEILSGLNENEQVITFKKEPGK